MIASLRGRLAAVMTDGAVVEVGGVGYRVLATPKTLAGLHRGDEIHLHTVQYVREDVLALYAFRTDEERAAFELLLSATGVGPKLALSMLAVHAPTALWRAIRAGDLDALMLVSGVGKKGAARLVLELKSKVGDGEVDIADPDGAARPVFAEVREALVGLGYAPNEARAALEALPADAADRSVQDLLRLALRALSTGGAR